VGLGDVGQLDQLVTAHPTGDRGQPDEEEAVLLRGHADVVAGGGRDRRCRPVDQRAVQVLVLQDLPELLNTPVGDQELDPGAGPQPSVAVVAEDAHHARPDVGDLVDRHPGTEALGQHRVGGKTATHPDVEAGTVFGVVDPDEGDVVDLRDHIVDRMSSNGRLELAGEVGELRIADVARGDLLDRRRRVDQLVRGDARHR
jgi:hypothetical protein